MPVNPERTAEAPMKSEDYDSDDADIELISSDNVRFKVHSYRLQSTSSVFRSMIALAKSSSQRDPVYLTHTTFERGEIVLRALNIMYTLNFDYGSDEWDLPHVLSVIEFAKKWEISCITDFIHRDLERRINSKNGPTFISDSFVIALKLDKNDLAATYAALPANYTGCDDPPSYELMNDYLCDTPKASLSQKHPLLDININDNSILGNIPHDRFLCIPPTVVWIILRAQGLKGKTAFSQEDIIRQLLDLAYPPPETQEASKKRKAKD